MVDIPTDIQIKALLCPGRVYLFKAEEHGGEKKHFHVVLNTDPNKDECVIMVTASSISLVHSTDYWSQLAASGVIVQAVPGDAYFIQHPSLFRCDTPIIRSVDEVISKLAEGLLLQKGIVNDPLLSKLRQGVLSSKTVTDDIKDLLRT